MLPENNSGMLLSISFVLLFRKPRGIASDALPICPRMGCDEYDNQDRSL
jgi:hypothetical protein